MKTADVSYGDILWLKLPQSLAPLDVAAQQPYKIRPFIVISPFSIKVDHNNVAMQERSILGVDCTSQDILIRERPHIAFNLCSHPDKTTYALIDSVRDINSKDQKIWVNDHLPQDKADILSKSLGEVLQPEQRFFLKHIFQRSKDILPGQIRRIQTINADGEALILFRRGQFVMDASVERSEDFDPSCHKLRYTPYLVAYFHRHKNVQTPRGITWNDITVMAVHERDIHEKTAEFSSDTVGNIVNQLRRRINLPPIVYQQMAFRHHMSALAVMRALALPRLR